MTPFLAGLSGMCPRRFAFYNVPGAVLWYAGLLLMGFRPGKIAWVREPMSWLCMGMVVLSLLPLVFEWKRSAKMEGG